MSNSSLFSFSEATRLNPQAAKFIAGGLIVFFGAAQITSMFSDLKTAITVAGLLLVFCCAIPLFQHMISNPKQRAVLSWACIVVFIGLMGGYINSVLFQWGNPPGPKCYFRIITAQTSRQECEAEFSTTSSTIGSEDARLVPDLHPRGAAKIWRAQMVWTVADYGVDNPYTNGYIYLQFSDNVERKDAIRLSKALDATGWPIEGGEKGGEHVSNAPTDNEVRFFDKANEEAATALAQRLYELNPGTPIKVKNFSKLGRVGGRANLEIWLNKISLTGVEG